MTSRSQRVLAIDPGELVGWATGSAHPTGELELRGHGITELKPFAVKLADRIHTYDVVVYENYRLVKKLNKEGSDMPTSQLIGMIRLLAWTHPEVQLVKQTPSHKNTADKAATGVFKELIERESSVHDDAHDIDAIRHLYYWWWKLQMKEVKRGK